MKYTKEAISKKMEKDNNIKLVFKIIAYIIIIPIIVYNIYVIAYSAVNQNQMPSFFGTRTYVIASGSMEPTIKVGDIIITKECDQSDLKIGDIISYKYGDTVITHRISQIINTPNGDEYITKGDNNNTEDAEAVQYKDIQGKYVQKIGFAGKILMFLKSRAAIICVVILILLLYIHEIHENKELKERSRKRKRHNWEVSQQKAKQSNERKK